MSDPVQQKKRRIRRAALGAALTLLVAGGGYGYTRYRAAAGEWSHVDTIRDDASYQDLALLQRAWALPVASAFRGGFVSQPNGSFCGQILVSYSTAC